MPRLSRSLLVLFCSLLISWLPPLNAEPVDAMLAQAPASRLSLNGSWQFRYQAGPTPAETDFIATGFDDKSWSAIVVPGHWELQGFAEPKYGRELEAGIGF